MKIRFGTWVMAGLVAILGVSGCGGGGSSPAPQGATVIKGTASAGIVYPGTVNAYAVSTAGAKGSLLGTTSTSIDGKYSLSLGAYSGAVLVEASGTYTDEATGHTVTIPASSPLHAMVDLVDDSTNNNRVVAVTPLTELAWRKASANGASPTPAAGMASANRLVDDLFKVSDIIGTEPVRADNASMATASQEAQAYTLTLAAISHMASTATGATDIDKLESTLHSMETEVESADTSGSMNSTMITELSSSLDSLVLSTDFPSAREQLGSVGKKAQLLTLATSGTLPAGTKIYGIRGTIGLPVDSTTNQLKVSLRADSSGKTLSDVLQLAGVALDKGSDPIAMYRAPQQEVTFTVVLDAAGAGIGVGDFATLAYDVMTGATVTAADFSLVSAEAIDANGASIVGITVVAK